MIDRRFLSRCYVVVVIAGCWLQRCFGVMLCWWYFLCFSALFEWRAVDCCEFGCCGGSWVVCCGVGFGLQGCDVCFVD